MGCLEFILLYKMCQHLNRTATARGHTGWPFSVGMVVGWFVAGIAGAVVGYMAEGMPNTRYSVGALCGYAVGVAMACGGMALVVNALSDRAHDHERAAVGEQEEYIEWRKRQGSPKKARLADEEDEEPVDLQPADAPTPPRAERAWKRRDWDGE